MKRFWYFVLTVFVFVFLPYTVKAAGDAWDPNISGGGSASHSGGCSGQASCWNDQFWGIRVSVVDASGNRLKTQSGATTYSYDLMANDPLSTYKSSLYSVTSKPNKYEAIGRVSFNKGYDGYESGVGLSDFYDKGAGNNIVKNFLESKYLIPVSKGGDGGDALLKKMGYSLADAKQDCAQGDIFLVVEPITVIRHGSNHYVGTGTELAQYIFNNNLTWIKSIISKGTVPLSIITPNTMAGITGVSTASKKFTLEDVNSKKGYAIGFFNLKGYIEDCSPQCTWTTPTKCCYLGDKLTGKELEDFKKAHPDCYGPEEPPKGDLCDFSLSVSIPNNCDKKTEGYVKDTKNWECIYASRTSKNPNIQNHFYKWENRYCSVFCREDVEYQYPDSSMEVLAGRRFTLGASGYFPTLTPIKFTGTSECRIYKGTGDAKKETINYDLFREDWIKANEEMQKAWDNYQIAEIKQYLRDHPKSTTSCKQCCSGCCGTCKPGGSSCCGDSKTTGPKYSYSTAKYTNYKGQTQPVTVGSTCCAACGSCDRDYNASGLYQIYISKKNYRDNLLKRLKKCNNFQYTNKYFQPEVYFKYEEAIYGGKTYNLNKKLTINSNTSYYVGNRVSGTTRWGTSGYANPSNDFLYSYNNYGKTTTVVKNNCPESSPGSGTNRKACTPYNNEKYPINDWVQQTTQKNYTYTLPSGVYEYIAKPSGQSFNTYGEAKAYGKNVEYLGYSNLPVHYSRAEDRYKFELDYNTFGPNHKFNKFIFEGAEIGQSFGTSLDIYSYLWNNTTLNSLINHCEQSGNHLGHNFVSAIGGRLNEFMASGCAQQYNCRMSGSRKVICDRYQDASGRWTTASSRAFSSSSYETYRQLRACIQSKVVTMEGRPAFTGKTKYECTYKVKNKIIDDCDPRVEVCDGRENKNLNLIYRPISLVDPFPGISGKGRTPGENWNQDYLINTYIKNNRSVADYKIYNELDPMYKIVLTPALIKEIRKYNDQQERKQETYYDKTGGTVTGIAGYSDFNLTCDANNVNCKSDFIRKSLGSYNFSKFFTGCGINGKNAGLKCVKGDAW